MNLIEGISYETQFTMEDGVYSLFHHNEPCIGLSIDKNNNPILFIITDHEPKNMGSEKVISFLSDEGSNGLRLQRKGLEWDKIMSDWLLQDLSTILEEKDNVLDEVLFYPINDKKYDFVKSIIETSGKIEVIHLIVNDLASFNTELERKMNEILELTDSNNISEMELKILIDSNNMNYFDICGVVEWLENSGDLSDFPVKVSKIEKYTVEVE